MLIKSHTLNEIFIAKHEKLIGASYSHNKSEKLYPGLKYKKWLCMKSN